jgi:hypothetical protein
MWHTAIVTATEWDNFFHLRDNAQAHPEIRKAAKLMRNVLASSEPIELRHGEWHKPLLDADTLAETFALFSPSEIAGGAAHKHLRKISVARCARVSYLTHDGVRNIQADVELHDRLLASGHLSPFEHVARPYEGPGDWDYGAMAPLRAQGIVATQDRTQVWFGNFRGWVQYRKMIPHERDIQGVSL